MKAPMNPMTAEYNTQRLTSNDTKRVETANLYSHITDNDVYQ